MQLSDITFVLMDVVDHYYMVVKSACSITRDKTRATVFNLVLDNGEFRTHPDIPKPFLTDPSHAWRPVYLNQETTDGRQGSAGTTG